MKTAHLRLSGPQQLELVGTLDRDTVESLQALLYQHLKKASSWQVNLSQVEHCDSAGLALLLDCWRFAKQHQLDLSFTQLPQQLIALAKVSDVASFLPIK